MPTTAPPQARLVSLPVACQLSGMSRWQLVQAIQRGDLTGCRDARQWWILASSFDRFIEAKKGACDSAI